MNKLKALAESDDGIAPIKETADIVTEIENQIENVDGLK